MSISSAAPRAPGVQRHARVPSELRPWLFDTRSLTRRIARQFGGAPSVRVVSQRWRVPRRDERDALGLPPRQRALVREVVMTHDNAPWIFARSVLPATTLDRSRWRFLRLGTTPLGQVLFSIPGMRRATVTVVRPRIDATLIARCSAVLGEDARPQWQRDSIFSHRGGSLLVSEAFLDDMVNSIIRATGTGR